MLPANSHHPLNVAVQARSLLTAHEDFTTLLFDNGSEIQRPGFVFGYLKRNMSEETVEEVKRMSLTKDGNRAVFDVPSKLVKVWQLFAQPSVCLRLVVKLDHNHHFMYMALIIAQDLCSWPMAALLV